MNHQLDFLTLFRWLSSKVPWLCINLTEHHCFIFWCPYDLIMIWRFFCFFVCCCFFFFFIFNACFNQKHMIYLCFNYLRKYSLNQIILSLVKKLTKLQCLVFCNLWNLYFRAVFWRMCKQYRTNHFLSILHGGKTTDFQGEIIAN